VKLNFPVDHLSLKLSEMAEKITAGHHCQVSESYNTLVRLSAKHRIPHITVAHIHISDSGYQESVLTVRPDQA
jgi:hypothetical protein